MTNFNLLDHRKSPLFHGFIIKKDHSFFLVSTDLSAHNLFDKITRQTQLPSSPSPAHKRTPPSSMKTPQKLNPSTFLGLLLLSVFRAKATPESGQGCDALASYYLWDGATLSVISRVLSTTIDEILSYNPQITNPNLISAGSRLRVPFSCGPVDGLSAGRFVYRVRSANATYQRIAGLVYSNLTTVEMLMRFNSYAPGSIPAGARVNVTVRCSCGDSRVSKDYGLFVTYPLRPGESLSGIASGARISERLLQGYNPGVDFGSGSGLVFIPGRDSNGTYPPLLTSGVAAGKSGAAIAGISLASVLGAIFLAACLYFGLYRMKKVTKDSFRHKNRSIENANESELSSVRVSQRKGVTVDKSVEFTHEELAEATNNFSITYKIGQGGYGAVYYGELRGEKAAIKKMDMEASKEFLAELKVLTHVHHVNLVHLIGYCVKGSLFLVYEYIDNDNLSQHLRGKGKEPLLWPTRLQIALDSARGLEYIHEHTVPLYIHRDVKSANILIDKNFRAKVADFGMAKLTEAGGASLQTRVVGTFGYMPPEYVCGDVSTKSDVYAFGVVLFELISGLQAVVKTNGEDTEAKGLVSLFEDAFNEPDQTESIRKLIDPRLGDEYPLDSVTKVAHLAKACTHKNPQQRPSMKSVVVALTTLSSSTVDSSNCSI
ncbi:receptor protein kinase [Striga asiatica]|uniref:non-specific serine/threonine protein kinase n=1 Tax=Striga asiatica TaxID=4170 RepID=A0A5A7RGG2_STRAF|nr:receptor protein kinase [Striga asiatica]